RFGKPDTEVLAPLGDSTQALQEPGQAPWPSRWISMDLSGLRVPESRAWWLVLTVEQGDVLWFVDPVAEGSSEARQTLYRRHGEHWQERRLPAAPPGEGQKRGPPRAARARTRVRVQAKHPPEVTLQISARGNHVTARPDEAGVVSLTRTEVQKLSGHTSNSQHNSKHNSKHNLVVAVQAPIRGRVSLSELCVRLKPRRTNLHFPDSSNMS
ncbi:MAG: hypothetical protein ACPG77_11000, partial [Nannocystaceae bacterium]